MATIKVKRSAVAGRIPATTDLELGEIAINTYDGVAYIKKNVSGTETVVSLGGNVELSQNLQNRYQYTATANQTTFAAVYLAPYVDVYLNGVRLLIGVEFTATNGTSIVLASGASAGNVIDIVAYTTYTANANYADLSNSIVVSALGFTPYNATNPSNFITQAQARGAISASGSLSYNSSTGVISYTTPTTSGITEGTNLYFTDARARAAISAGTGLTYNSSTGVITNSITQYTDALARSALSAGTGLTYNSSTGVITNSITQYTDALARGAISVTGAGSYNSTTGVITVTGGVTSVAGRTGAIILTNADVGLGSVEDKSSATIRGEITSSNVTAALGFTPYNATNPSSYITSAGARSAISATGSLSYNSTTGVLSYTAPTAVSAFTNDSGYLTANQSISVTGDATGSGATAISLTLANSGVTAGTYTKTTVDAKGRVTSGSTLSASDIPALDASKITTGVFDAARLPSYVDDVLEYANLAGFPASGETGKIYVALDTNKTYRWSGSAYVYITSGAVDSVAGKTGVVTLTSNDVGLGSVENKSSATIRGEITSTNVTSALGFTPYNATNPSGYTNNTGTVTSVNGTGTVSGLTLTGSVTTTGSLTLGGTLSLTSANVTGALGFTPYNATNPAGYITGITSGMVTTALGFTPYNATNPAGYITSAALGSYLPLSGGTIAGQLNVNNAGSATTVMRLWSAGSSIWSLGVGDSSGTNFNISSDFGSFLINKSSGNVTTSGQYYAGSSNLVLHLGNKDNYTYPPASHDHSRIGWTGTRTAESGTTNSTPSGFFEMVGAYNNGWPATYGNVLSANGGGAGQLYMGWIGGSGAETGELYYRSMTDWRTNWGSWRRIITDANYNSYSPTLTGGGASGTWGINITGNAATATSATDSTKLPLTGGTMTGQITLVPGTPWQVLAPGSGTYNRHVQYITGTEYTLEAAFATDSLSGSKLPITFTWRGGYGATGGLQLTGGAGGTLGGNTILHAGNYTSYANAKGGGWYGSGLPGTRWGGYSASGGEISFGDGLPNANQMGILVDGCYVAGENNGFWSLGSDNSWGSRRGMYWDGSYLNFTTNSATAYFTNALIGGNQIFHVGNYTSYNGIIRALGYPSGGNNWDALGNDYHNSVIQVDPSNFSSTANGPTAASYQYGTLLNLASNSSSKSQIYISHAGNDLIFRGGWGTGSWQTWNKVLTNQNYNSYSPTLTGGNASGTWGINVTGTASSISGFNNPTTAATANTIAYRDAAGDLTVRELVMNVAVQNFTPSSLVAIYPTTNQAVKVNATGARAFLDVPTRTGGDASGTWGIAISGNAATASKTTANAGYARVGYGMAPFYNWGGANAGAGAPSDSTYTTGIDVGSHPGDQAYGFQIASNMWNVGLWTRTYNSGFSGWVRLLDSSNYSSYALPLSGGTLSGALALSDSRLYLRTNGDTNHYLWNADDDWEEMVAYSGTGFRVKSSTGTTLATFTTGAVNAGVALQQGGNQVLHAGNYTSYAAAASHTQSVTTLSDRPDWFSGGSFIASHNNANEWRNSGFYENGGGGSNWPSATWYNSINVRHSNTGNYHGFQLAMSYYDNNLWFRSYQGSGTFQSWAVALSSQNYSSYALPLSGGTMSGNISFANDSAAGIFNAAGNAGYRPDDQWGNTYMFNQAGAGGWYGDFSGYYFRSSSASNWLTISGSAVNSSVALQQSGNQILHAGNYTSYTVNRGGDTLSGLWYFLSNRNTTSDSCPLQAFSNNGSGATMSFHRGGYYAVNFGLDSDNVMRIGGWSAAANRWQLDMSGNGTYAGNVTAYSDERLKKDWTPVQTDFITELAKVKSGTYTRIDSEQRQAGVSAQDFQKLLPETVSEDNAGTLSLAYGNAALVSAVELAKEVIDLRAQVTELRALIITLINKDLS